MAVVWLPAQRSSLLCTFEPHHHTRCTLLRAHNCCALPAPQGRMCTLMKKQDASLKYLEQVGMHGE